MEAQKNSGIASENKERSLEVSLAPIEKVERCIQNVGHANRCSDENCNRTSCGRIKRLLKHMRGCKKRESLSCPLCKQLVLLCGYHAKKCDKDSCSVPFCMTFRQKCEDRKMSEAQCAAVEGQVKEEQES